MSSAVVQVPEIKIENVSFKDPKKNTVGGQSVLLNYYNESTRKNGPLVIQTPKMRLPFGYNSAVPEGGGATKYSINASLANAETTNTNLKLFTKVMHDLDAATKKAAEEKSELWFSKKQKAEVLEEFYKSAEKKPKNDKYASTLKLKLPTKNVGDQTTPQFDVYNDQKELVNIVDDSGINLSCLQNGTEIVAIIQCTGVWFVGKTQFGLGWKVIQLKIFRNQKLVGYSIKDDDDEAEEAEEEVEYEEEEVEVG